MGATEAANKQLVEAFFEALSRVDVERVAALYADDFTLWTAGDLPLSGTRTRAEALAGMESVLGMFPAGLAFHIDAMTAEGERVAIEAHSEGVHVSGRPYANRYHFLVVAREGRIVQLKEYMDTLHAAEVLFGAAGPSSMS